MKIITSLAVFAALTFGAIRLPAVSCILSNSTGETACQPGCCANKACCVISAENTRMPSPPPANSSAHDELTAVLANVVLLALPAEMPVIDQPLAPRSIAPPPSVPRLALFCTFLI